MRTITVSTDIHAAASTVWPAVKTPHAFVHVAGAMLRYPAAEKVDRPWAVGDVLEGWTFLFRFVPFDHHRLEVVEVDDAGMQLVSDERGGPIRRWRHSLLVDAVADKRCRYTDTIEIDAGPLTAAVAAFAAVFYRYRQHRWRSLGRLLESVRVANVGTESSSVA